MAGVNCDLNGGFQPRRLRAEHGLSMKLAFNWLAKAGSMSYDALDIIKHSRWSLRVSNITQFV